MKTVVYRVFATFAGLELVAERRLGRHGQKDQRGMPKWIRPAYFSALR